MAKFAVILPAAGQSSRFKDKEKKPFAVLDGRAVWLRCPELFVTRDDVLQTIIVVSKADQETFRRRYAANMAFMCCALAGGRNELRRGQQPFFDQQTRALVRRKVRRDKAEACVGEDAHCLRGKNERRDGRSDSGQRRGR